MDTDIRTVNVELSAGERELIKSEFSTLEAVIRNFPRPAVHVEVERSPRKGGLGVSIHVRLSTRSLFATSWGGNLRSAMEQAMDKVVRQARKHLSVLKRHETAGSDSLKSTAHDASPTAEDLESIRDIEDFSDQVGPHTARLHKVLRRELRLDPRAEALGDMVSLPDIVEEALAYVFEHYREKPAEMTPDRWLVRRGLIFLDAELDRLAGAPGDSNVPKPGRPRELPAEDWEELLQLPNVELDPLEDRAGDASQTSPPILGDRHEAQRETAAALMGLKERPRQALLLHHLEGYQVPEIAYVLNTEESQVESWLMEAETTLQDRLRAWRKI